VAPRATAVTQRLLRCSGRCCAAAAPLRILILGGTGFIGPNQVRYAVARGHKVTLFNRGRTNPGLFKNTANIEERLGDRAPKPGDYASLRDR